MRTHQGTYETEIEVSLTVRYTAVPAYKGKTDGRFGPKIEPDEPAHIEIDDVRDSFGNVIKLTDSQRDRIIEDICTDEADAYADHMSGKEMAREDA